MKKLEDYSYNLEIMIPTTFLTNKKNYYEYLWSNELKENLVNFIQRNKLTLLLLLVILSQVLLIFSLKSDLQEVKSADYSSKESKDESNFYLKSSLFPSDIDTSIESQATQKNDSVQSSSTNKVSKNEEISNQLEDEISIKKPVPTPKSGTKKVTISKKTPKQSPTPTPIPSPTKSPEYTEEKISTVAGRDEERILIAQLITDNITEYYFKYGLYPGLYKDKSQTELSTDPSYIIYFYNNEENKTNALAFTLGDDKGDYSLSRVVSCENIEVKENELKFSYHEAQLNLCRENGDVEVFWIVN